MDFTEIKSLRNYKQDSVKANSHLNSTLHDHISEDYQIDLKQALQNIQELNFARSLPNNSINPQSFDNSIHIPESYNEISQEVIYNRELQRKGPRKSNIFMQNNKIIKPNGLHVLVYYFGLPMSKYVSYQSNTTILNLTMSALLNYTSDPYFDKGKLRSLDPTCYQMRFPINEGDWRPDYKLDPIHYSRLISQNLFEELVLVLKDTTPSILNPQTKMRKNSAKPPLKITILNEIKEYLGCVTVNWDDNLEQIFKFIEGSNLHFSDYRIYQQLDDQNEIDRNFQVKQLSSHKLYVKSKRYEDEGEEKPIVPFYIQQLEKKAQNTFVPPIGINQASLYQQFEVIKYNPFGFAQERILGIDQEKIYNYQKSIRKQKADVSFLGSFFGLDKITGTKRPYRLISQILSIEYEQETLIITFKDKKTQYKVVDKAQVSKILRKLNFLKAYSSKK